MPTVGTVQAEPHNQFEFCAQGLENDKGLLRYWNCKDRTFGTTNWSVDTIGKGTVTQDRLHPNPLRVL